MIAAKLQAMLRAATVKSQSRRLTRVAAHIAAHLDEPLDLERLAAVACLSPYHFHRLYRTHWRETAAGTLSRLRLARAALELTTTSRPLAIVARRAGFGSLSAFSRAFAAVYGAPPSRSRAAPSQAKESAMQIEIAERGPMRIAYLTHVGPHHAIAAAFERLYAWAGPRGLTGPPAVGVAVYLDDARTTPAANLRSQAAITVPDDVAGDAEVKVRELPGGRYATLMLKGPYAQLNAAYAALFAWLEGGGTRGDGPIVEVYLNDPHDTAPADLETEIRLPLA